MENENNRKQNPKAKPKKSRRPGVKRSEVQFRKTRKDIYVSTKITLKELVSTCENVLKDESEIFIHCFGRTANKGITLALKLTENSLGLLSLDVHTSTREVTDDIYPLTDEDDFLTQRRMISCLHIRLYKVDASVKNCALAWIDRIRDINEFGCVFGIHDCPIPENCWPLKRAH